MRLLTTTRLLQACPCRHVAIVTDFFWQFTEMTSPVMRVHTRTLGL